MGLIPPEIFGYFIRQLKLPAMDICSLPVVLFFIKSILPAIDHIPIPSAVIDSTAISK
jgi:hypothetical protein